MSKSNLRPGQGSSSSWHSPEELLERFERAWALGPPPDLRDFVPVDANQRRSVLAALARIDLERRLKSGESARVETYLQAYPELTRERERVLELIKAEFKIRRRRDPSCAADEYQQRFPDYWDALQADLPTVSPTEPPGADPKTAPESPTAKTIADEARHTRGFFDGLPAALPVLPGYDILGEMGRGAMGVVYRARQLNLNRLVALKMIRDGALAGPQQLSDFQREAEAAARLAHPNIIHIYELGTHHGLPYFSMELIEGGSLAQRLLQAPIPTPAAVRLVEKLARAIQHAHDHAIVHRDLKPANVLLQAADSRLHLADADGDPHPGAGISNLQSAIPKIADFGLAKRLNDDPSTHGGIKGTPQYMAPEQAAGRSRTVGPAVDVYSLGAILYELLAGRAPFQGPSLADILDKVRFHNPRPPGQWKPGLDPDLDTVCLKCLSKDPADRYPSAAALADDLSAYLRGAPIQGRTTGDLQMERLKKHISNSSISPALKQAGSSLAQLESAGFEIQGPVKRTDWTILYLGRHRERGLPVYLKVMLPTASPERRADFRYEAEVLSRVRHPCLPEFFGAGELDGLHFIAFEVVEGQKLSQVIARKPSFPDAVRLLESLCRCVHEGHRQGIVHHDLKPASLLVTADGSLKVTNFGLPRAPEDEEDPSLSQLLDLLRYKAPEQMDAEPVPVNRSVNVYTLGTIAYELLAGTPPFKMRSLFGAMEQLRTQEPPPPSESQPAVPTAVDAICLRCLRRDPKERYANAGEIADALRPFLSPP